MRVTPNLSDCAMLEGAHSTVVLLTVKCLKRPRTELQHSMMTTGLLKLEELRHPHIVQYYLNSLESDEVDITVIMEAWGVSVPSLITSKQHCGKVHIASFAAQVLRALICLHLVGIAETHRASSHAMAAYYYTTRAPRTWAKTDQSSGVLTDHAQHKQKNEGWVDRMRHCAICCEPNSIQQL